VWDWQQKLDRETVYILTDISPNTWWTCSENHRERTIWTINHRVFLSGDTTGFKYLQESMSSRTQKLNLERLDLTNSNQEPTHKGEEPAAELHNQTKPSVATAKNQTNTREVLLRNSTQRQNQSSYEQLERLRKWGTGAVLRSWRRSGIGTDDHLGETCFDRQENHTAWAEYRTKRSRRAGPDGYGKDRSSHAGAKTASSAQSRKTIELEKSGGDRK
jgi:hypothetical protein